MEKLKYIGFSITCFAILFKLMSWQYADKLLIAGLGSLGIYFLIKVFKKYISDGIYIFIKTINQ